MSGEQQIEMSQEQWEQEGKRLFGPVRIQWGFVCPSCGHVQTPNDFRPYKDQGATPNTAYLNCIGRYDGEHGDVEIGTRPGPCNYTSGGLFKFNPVTVTPSDGSEPVHVFAFARPEDVPPFLGDKKNQ